MDIQFIQNYSQLTPQILGGFSTDKIIYMKQL